MLMDMQLQTDPRRGRRSQLVLSSALLLGLVGLVACSLVPREAVAQLDGVFGGAPAAAEAPGDGLEGWDRVADGWRDLGRWDILLDIGIVLLVAMMLGASIAYHPLTRSKVSSIEEFEQPKTFIMYAMVGAVVAQIVQVKPAMALVVFGIGGLLRFRTDVGQAKDTGRVILVTVVGLCCGLKIFVVAFLATIFGWLLIYYLESQQAERVQIKGIDKERIPEAADHYRGVLQDSRCKIIRERKNFTKSQVTFVFSFPSGVDRESLQHRFEGVPAELRGTVDWETT